MTTWERNNAYSKSLNLLIGRGGAIRLGDFKLIEYFEYSTVQLFSLRDDLPIRTAEL